MDRDSKNHLEMKNVGTKFGPSVLRMHDGHVGVHLNSASLAAHLLEKCSAISKVGCIPFLNQGKQTCAPWSKASKPVGNNLGSDGAEQ
eukprot:5590237-Amphidinium_carterae.1